MHPAELFFDGIPADGLRTLHRGRFAPVMITRSYATMSIPGIPERLGFVSSLGAGVALAVVAVLIDEAQRLNSECIELPLATCRAGIGVSSAGQSTSLIRTRPVVQSARLSGCAARMLAALAWCRERLSTGQPARTPGVWATLASPGLAVMRSPALARVHCAAGRWRVMVFALSEFVGWSRAIRESSLFSMATHDGDARYFGEPNGEPTTTAGGLRQATVSCCQCS